MEQEINKYLTEAMGECWHEWIEENFPCSNKCFKCNYPVGIMREECIHPDFSTWTGFGKLWEWARKQDWWSWFKNAILYDNYETYINSENFAKAVYDYLKEREDKE